MKLADILKEELNTQFVNKELSGLESVKKQLDAVVAANPLLSKSLTQPVQEIDKKITSLKYAVAEYSKRKQMETKQGVGTQTQTTATQTATTLPVTKTTTKETQTPTI